MIAVKETSDKGDTSQGSISAISIIARKEILVNFLNFKIPVSFGALLLFFLLSAHLLALDYRYRADNWSVNRAAQRDPSVGGMARYALSDGSFFHTVGANPDSPMQPPRPLSVLVKGLDNEVDRSITLGQSISFGPRQNDKVHSVLYESPDTEFIVKLLLSLFALFFTLDSITVEKQRGTLRSLLAHPVRHRDILLGKSIGASVSLFAPFSLAYFSAVAYLYEAHGLLRDEGQLARSLMIFCVGLLYGLVFIFLGLFISTITSRTKTAVVTALLAWATLVLVLPNASVLATKLFFPAPSYNQFNARLYEARRQITEQELRANPGIQSVFNSPNAKQTLFLTYEIDRQLTDEYLMRKCDQIDRSKNLAIFLPTGALTFGLSEIADTGPGAYRSYVNFLRDGRDSMVDALKRRWDMKPEDAIKFLEETAAKVALRQRPPNPLSASLQSAVASIVSLIIWACLFWLAASWRFRRYDVR